MRRIFWLIVGLLLGATLTAAWAQAPSDLESIVTILRGRLEECRLANKELTAKLPPPAAPAAKPKEPSSGKSN